MIISLLLSCFLASHKYDHLDDRVFALVQIDMIANFGVVHDFDHVMPRRQAMLLRQLACEHYECRYTAQETLKEMGLDAFECLGWGCRAKDPNIRIACKSLIKLLFKCYACDGEGFTGKNLDTSRWDFCHLCGGTGDERYTSDPRWNYGYKLREFIFPRNE